MQTNGFRFALIGMMLVFALAGCAASENRDGANESLLKGTTTSKGGSAGKATTLAEILLRGQKAGDFYCGYELSSDGGQVLAGRLWMSSNKLRTESDQGNHDATAIFIHNGSKGYSYMYTSGQKQALKVTDSQPIEGINPMQVLLKVPENIPILGKEICDGAGSVLVQYKQDGVENRVWLAEDHGLPLRIESTYDNSTTVIEYKNYRFEELSADCFELPPGMEVVGLPGTGLDGP